MPKTLKKRPKYPAEVKRGVSVFWGPRGGAGFILPSLKIELAGGSLVGGRRGIDKAASYGRVFKRGENIIDIHIDCKDWQTMENLIRKVRGVAQSLKALGFAGICCDTPNTALKRILVEVLGMDEVPMPKNVEKRIIGNYRWRVKHSGYPEKYAKGPVSRMVLRI